MADEYLTEESTYADKIRMVSEDDPVLGGTKGPVNIALKGIADRTAYLKKLCADLAATIPGTAEFDRIYQEIAKLDVAKLDGRMDHAERLIGNIMLSLQAANMSPTGYDAMMVETFDKAEEVDQTVSVVNSIVSGDDSIDVATLSGIIIGLHYQLTDGESVETVQVKSTATAGTINRVILEDAVKNQYVAGRAKLYRSSVAIYNGRAYGGGSVKTDTWEPNKTFSGSSTTQDVTTTISYNNASIFTLENATIENGKIIIGSDAVGLVMVSQGSTAGVWQRVDENGDDVA